MIAEEGFNLESAIVYAYCTDCMKIIESCPLVPIVKVAAKNHTNLYGHKVIVIEEE